MPQALKQTAISTTAGTDTNASSELILKLF
jgi:hypothetical protein